jgi:hypothetical protein
MINTFRSIRIVQSAEILDFLKQVFDIKNDSQLARFLDVTRASIHTLRQPGRSIGKHTRLVVMEKINHRGIPNWRQRLSREYIENKLRESGFTTDELNPERAFLSLLKSFYKCDNDLQLARILDLKPNTLSMYRVGRTSLGTLPMLRVFCDIEKLSYEELMPCFLYNSSFKTVIEDAYDKQLTGRKAE